MVERLGGQENVGLHRDRLQVLTQGEGDSRWKGYLTDRRRRCVWQDQDSEPSTLTHAWSSEEPNLRPLTGGRGSQPIRVGFGPWEERISWLPSLLQNAPPLPMSLAVALKAFILSHPCSENRAPARPCPPRRHSDLACWAWRC